MTLQPDSKEGSRSHFRLRSFWKNCRALLIVPLISDGSDIGNQQAAEATDGTASARTESRSLMLTGLGEVAESNTSRFFSLDFTVCQVANFALQSSYFLHKRTLPRVESLLATLYGHVYSSSLPIHF